MASSTLEVRHPNVVSHAEWLAARSEFLTQRERVHPPARRIEPPAPRSALGKGREAV